MIFTESRNAAQKRIFKFENAENLWKSTSGYEQKNLTLNIFDNLKFAVFKTVRD